MKKWGWRGEEEEENGRESGLMWGGRKWGGEGWKIGVWVIKGESDSCSVIGGFFFKLKFHLASSLCG